MYRAAVIGCGKIGSEYAEDPRIKDIYTHAGAYAKCPETELFAVCDKDAEKVRRCKDRWHAQYSFTDYLDMILRTSPDIVSVCTPDQTHFEIISTILKETDVKAVYAEKPLALKLDEANEIVKLADRKRVILAINYTRRYAVKLFETKKRIDSGAFGRIQTINGYYCKGTRHNGTHWFDLARFFAGNVKKVMGFDRIGERNDDPTFDAYLEFHSGSSGFLHSCDETLYNIFEMDILCSKGRISIREFGHKLELFTVAKSPYYSGYYSLNPDGVFTEVMKDAMVFAVEDIVSCLRTGRVPRCSGSDGVAALEIAEAVSSSSVSGHFEIPGSQP